MRMKITGTMILLLVVSPSVRAEWKMADGPLKTRWAKDVSADNVWGEYPRPQMVRQQWSNLNGLWDYAIVSKDAPRPERWDGKILVPFCVESALSGVMKRVGPDRALWYRRQFSVPGSWSGKRVLLHFQAVDWEASVWVNGKKVGEHRGGYDPFEFDITESLKSPDNNVVVRVWDPTNRGYQPRGKQVLKPGGIWYTAVTGIWQTAWLEPVPRTHIHALRVVPEIDRSAVRVTAESSGQGPVDVEVLAEGRVVARARGQSGQPISARLEDLKLWSPDTPFLYDLKVKLAAGSSSGGDEITSYFGMRKVNVAKDESGVNRLFLNGKPLFQYGPLDQGWWPDGLYTAATDAALRYDVEVTKKLGMNMARKHVKVEHARWYYWCDKLGLMVWQDMASGNNSGDEGQQNFQRELKNVITAFANHPSIIMWVPFNEGWGQHDTERIVALVKQWDPTRPVNESSGWHNRGSGDVRDVHSYPGPGMPPLEDGRVAVLGEFGGLGLPVRGHTWQDEKNWGYRSFKTREALTDAYVGLLTRLRPLIGRGLSAAVYTQTSDVEIEVNGLMTYDREMIKLDADRIAEAARKLYLPPPIVKPLVPTSRQAPQTWRYTIEKPAAGWFREDFDDSSWKSGPGGFGRKDTPGAVARSEWTSSDIWIRRTFELSQIPSDTRLLIHHDEDAEVYINGQLAAELSHYTVDYALETFRSGTKLRLGRNTIAIHCRQTSGGQYIDAGLVEYRER